MKYPVDKDGVVWDCVEGVGVKEVKILGVNLILHNYLYKNIKESQCTIGITFDWLFDEVSKHSYRNWFGVKFLFWGVDIVWGGGR